MRSVSSRELIGMLKRNGWNQVAVHGSHYQFRHATIAKRVTIPHPKTDLPWPTVRSILKQPALTEEDLE